MANGYIKTQMCLLSFFEWNVRQRLAWLGYPRNISSVFGAAVFALFKSSHPDVSEKLFIHIKPLAVRSLIERVQMRSTGGLLDFKRIWCIWGVRHRAVCYFWDALWEDTGDFVWQIGTFPEQSLYEHVSQGMSRISRTQMLSRTAFSS